MAKTGASIGEAENRRRGWVPIMTSDALSAAHAVRNPECRSSQQAGNRTSAIFQIVAARDVRAIHAAEYHHRIATEKRALSVMHDIPRPELALGGG